MLCMRKKYPNDLSADKQGVATERLIRSMVSLEQAYLSSHVPFLGSFVHTGPKS